MCTLYCDTRPAVRLEQFASTVCPIMVIIIYLHPGLSEIAVAIL